MTLKDLLTKFIFQDNADSKLLEMLPTDQKLHLFHERLQTSRDELQNERHRRQQLEQETMQLKSSLVSFQKLHISKYRVQIQFFLHDSA